MYVPILSVCRVYNPWIGHWIELQYRKPSHCLWLVKCPVFFHYWCQKYINIAVKTISSNKEMLSYIFFLVSLRLIFSFTYSLTWWTCSHNFNPTVCPGLLLLNPIIANTVMGHCTMQRRLRLVGTIFILCWKSLNKHYENYTRCKLSLKNLRLKS